MEVTEPVQELEMKVIDLDTGKPLKTSKPLKDDTEELELEVNETVEEAVAEENTGGLDTEFDPTLDLSNYQFPSLELLEEHGSDKVKIDAEELGRNRTRSSAR